MTRRDVDIIAEKRLPQRLSMTTLGVRDVAAARAFYERLGLVAANFESDQVCFFDMGGTVLGLYGHQALADDAGVPVKGEGFRAVTLAINLDSEPAVDAALALAAEGGARIVKPAEQVFWGGYSGYFEDPDGHLWEVAYNPLCNLDEAGHLELPPPVTPA